MADSGHHPDIPEREMIPDNKEDGYLYPNFFGPQVDLRPQSLDTGTDIYRSPQEAKPHPTDGTQS
jgi:hypothetical protein